jgi:hypothetical protein
MASFNIGLDEIRIKSFFSKTANLLEPKQVNNTGEDEVSSFYIKNYYCVTENK